MISYIYIYISFHLPDYVKQEKVNEFVEELVDVLEAAEDLEGIIGAENAEEAVFEIVSALL